MNIGDKVVLVDDQWPASVTSIYAALPIKGPVYLVRHVAPGVDLDVLLMDRHRKLGFALFLVGLVNPGPNGREMGFGSHRFRKLTSRHEQEANTAKATI